jgi:amidase
MLRLCDVIAGDPRRAPGRPLIAAAGMTRAVQPETDDTGAFMPGPRVARTGLPAGPLAGVTFAVKDLIAVAGEPTGCGNPDWLRAHAPEAETAPSVQRLLAAGATLAGKTVTDEFAFSLEGDNAHYGMPRNPQAPGRLPGGSSSGSAVAVAAGLVDFALGTDTGGSVRVPASFCGIFGFRPSHGRVPLAGVMPFAPSYDTVGWFAREGELLRRAGAVLLDAPRPERPLRLRLARDALRLCEDAAAKAVEAAARRLGLDGEIDVFGGREAVVLECYRVLQGYEIRQSLGAQLSAVAPRLGSRVATRIAGAFQISAELAKRFEPVRQEIAARLDALLEDGIAIVLPTAPCPPPVPGAFDEAAFYAAALTLTSAAGHAGLPQVSLPLAEVDGLPLGVSVLGGRSSDESLLALAAATPPVEPW